MIVWYVIDVGSIVIQMVYERKPTEKKKKENSKLKTTTKTNTYSNTLHLSGMSLCNAALHFH